MECTRLLDCTCYLLIKAFDDELCLSIDTTSSNSHNLQEYGPVRGLYMETVQADPADSPESWSAPVRSVDAPVYTAINRSARAPGVDLIAQPTHHVYVPRLFFKKYHM